jgi:superfamily I DNA/RNA helicase
MKFLAESKKATIKGGDIGKQMIGMIKQTKTKTNDAMFNKMNKDLDKLIDKMRKAYPHKEAEKMAQVVNLQDKIGALKAIAVECKTNTTQEVIDTITTIFTDNTEGIVLSTMHKSKGLEASNIFIIEPQLCPAPYAKQEWQQIQEQNLIYVARTRAKEQLVYVQDWTCDEDKKNNVTSKLRSMGLLQEQ